jgi:hypothetical protein
VKSARDASRQCHLAKMVQAESRRGKLRRPGRYAGRAEGTDTGTGSPLTATMTTTAATNARQATVAADSAERSHDPGLKADSRGPGASAATATNKLRSLTAFSRTGRTTPDSDALRGQLMDHDLRVRIPAADTVGAGMSPRAAGFHRETAHWSGRTASTHPHDSPQPRQPASAGCRGQHRSPTPAPHPATTRRAMNHRGGYSRFWLAAGRGAPGSRLFE